MANHYNRFRRWVTEGLWDRIWSELVRNMDQLKKIGRKLWSIDGSVIRAHRTAAGGSRKVNEIAKKTPLVDLAVASQRRFTSCAKVKVFRWELP